MPKKQGKPAEGWHRIVGFKASPEQETALGDAMRAYRKRTGDPISLADIARDHGAASFVRAEGLVWPEKKTHGLRFPEN